MKHLPSSRRLHHGALVAGIALTTLLPAFSQPAFAQDAHDGERDAPRQRSDQSRRAESQPRRQVGDQPVARPERQAQQPGRTTEGAPIEQRQRRPREQARQDPPSERMQPQRGDTAPRRELAERQPPRLRGQDERPRVSDRRHDPDAQPGSPAVNRPEARRPATSQRPRDTGGQRPAWQRDERPQTQREQRHRPGLEQADRGTAGPQRRTPVHDRQRDDRRETLQRLDREQQDTRIREDRRRAEQFQHERVQQQRLAEQRARMLQQQRRMAQSRYQQQYHARLHERQRRWQSASYDYYRDPFYYTPASYRYSYGGRWYQTNRYGADLMRQAVSYGYEEGLRAGRADREDRWRYDVEGSYGYLDASYGYDGHYIARDQYHHYFRQGFRRGYEDGYYGRSRYGHRDEHGDYKVLAAVLGIILGLQLLH